MLNATDGEQVYIMLEHVWRLVKGMKEQNKEVVGMYIGKQDIFDLYTPRKLAGPIAKVMLQQLHEKRFNDVDFEFVN